MLPLGIVSIGQDVVRRPDQGHIGHISGVHQQLLLILEDGEPARLQQGNADVHGMFSH